MPKKRINVQLDESEYNTVTALAERHKTNRSEIMRLALFGELAEKDKRKNHTLSDADRKDMLCKIGGMMKAIDRIRHANKLLGDNVNQIAKMMHTGARAESKIDVQVYDRYGKHFADQLELVAEEMERLWRTLV